MHGFWKQRPYRQELNFVREMYGGVQYFSTMKGREGIKLMLPIIRDAKREHCGKILNMLSPVLRNRCEGQQSLIYLDASAENLKLHESFRKQNVITRIYERPLLDLRKFQLTLFRYYNKIFSSPKTKLTFSFLM